MSEEHGFHAGESIVVRGTERALLVRVPEHGDTWIPRKVIHDDSEVFDTGGNSEGELVVEYWWARKQGWVIE